jgi:hypothetical protein
MDEDQMKTKIVVCGDSFCASPLIDYSINGARSHFSNMLEDTYNYDVVNLAHGGMSNVAIWFQLEQALKLNPDVVVYNKTWSTRIEITLRETTTDNHEVLKNFIYYDPCFSSTHTNYVGKVDKNARVGSSIVSAPFENIENSPFFDLTKEQLTAIKLYLKYIYHDHIDSIIDGWVFEYWHARCLAQGVFTLCFNDKDVGAVAYDFSGKNREYDTPYHTDRATQEKVAANIHKKIMTNQG